MSAVVISGDSSGSISLQAPAVAGTTTLTLPTTSGTLATQGVGQGQTWTNVVGSRSSGTTYTNSTGKPILVSITRAMAASNSHSLTIDGVVVGSFANPFGDRAVTVCLSGIVPDGVSYSVSGSGTISYWAELR